MNRSLVTVLLSACKREGLGLALTLMAAIGATATNAPVQLGIALTGPPGRQAVELSWASQAGAMYKLQHRATLGPENPWKDFDVFQPTGATFKVTLDGDPLKEEAHFREVTGFFRLVLPQPAISSIEPAQFAFGGPVDLYVVGQCFDTNTELRVGPLTLTNRIIVNPNLMQCSFVPPSAGTYVFELVVSGAVQSSFAVECFDPISPPASVLQEPPDEPWASPHFKEVTGLDVYIDCLEIQEGGVNSGAHKVKEKGNRTKCGNNLRVTPSGEVEMDEVDLFIPGVGLDFVWGRRYRSRSGPSGAQGNRWDFSYNVSVREVPGGMEVRDGMGRVDVLRPDAEGVYGHDGFFYIGQFSNSLFRITFPDSGYWEFTYPSGGTPGRLLRIGDRNSNTMRMEYDALGRLERVIDTLDRTNTIAYSPLNGKIASLTDFTGRRVSYAYYRTGDQGGSDGDLRSVTSPAVTGTPNGNDFPVGKTTTYAYSRGFSDPRENSLLLSVTDAKGQIKYKHVYQHNQTDLSFLRCLGQQLGNTNERITYAYLPLTPAPSNGFATQKIIVNDCVGNVSEHFYDARHRLLMLREFTGRAVPGWQVSDTTNRPAGKLRVDDPAFFETRYEWNADSLCTRVVHPRGNATETVYQRAFNQNYSRSNNAKRHDADVRVIRERACCGGADTDGDGAPDTEELVTRLDHDARFGAGLASKAMHDEDNSAGLPSSVRIIKDKETKRSKGFGFVTSSTDPRGTPTLAEYDAKGNRVKVRFHWDRSGADEERFAYNSHGQLTGVTNALDSEGCRRVDTFEYHDDPAMPGFGYLKRSTRDKGGFLCGNTTHFLIDTSYEYDPRGNVTRVVDPRGFDTITIYNALDQPVARQTPQSSFGTLVRTTTLFAYDANDNLAQVDVENRDHNGALDQANPYWSSFAEYDLLDRMTLLAHELTHVVQQRSATNRFLYDGNGNLVLEQSPEAANGRDPNNVVAYQYDERDLLFQVLPASGTGLAAVDRFDYDGNGNCKKVSKVDSFSIKQKVLEYDGFDRCVRTTDPMGNIESFAYNRNGSAVYYRLDGEMTDVPGSAGNRRLREARAKRDSIEQILSIDSSFFDTSTGLAIGDGEAATAFAYAPNGQLVSETDDNGHATRYVYDSAGRLASVTDAKTNIVLYAYDACGNTTNMTSIERSDLGGAEQRFSISSMFDGLGRLVSRADNVGNTHQYFYDSRNNLIRHIDPRGTLTGFTYDGLSRQTLAIADLDGDGLLDYAVDIGSASAYDDNSRLVSSTDDNGNVTRHAYDAVDRLVATTNADNTVVRLVWSPRSNLILCADANGTIVSNSFDLLDRCVRRDIAPAPGVAATTTLETFEYDGESRLTRAANNGVAHTFVWNPLSDLGEQSSGGLTLRATHDGVGNRLAAIYPSGRIVQHTYDALNQPIALSTVGASGLTQFAAYSYDGPGRLSRVARTSGINTRVNWNGLSNPVNPSGDFGWRQVGRVNHARAQGGGAIDQRIAAYDRAQNKILRAQTAPFSTGGDMKTNTFSYDPLNRLNSSVMESLLIAVPRTTTYQLDGNGNRQQVVENGVIQPYQMNAGLPEPADFQVNQYSLSPLGAHGYDRNGNLTSTDAGAGPTLYHYDYADRLVLVERTVGPAQFAVAAYAYDALGRRVSKTLFPPAPAAPVTTSWFLDADCDGDGIIEERLNGVLRGQDVLLIYDQNEAGRVRFTSAGETLYFHTDDLGNVLALTDASGSVVERYDYDDYGLPHFLDAKGATLVDNNGLPVTSSPAGNPFLFQGMYWDAETAFYHSQGRNADEAMAAATAIHDYLWSSGPFDPRTGRNPGRANGGFASRMNVTESGGSFANSNPWSGGGGGGSGGSMRAGISTSRSNLRTKSGLISRDDDDGGAACSMRAGISTSRSNLRTKSGLISRDDGDDGGYSTRAGISTSRSNIRTKNGLISGDGQNRGDKVEVMFNPKEYSISKVTVRGWNPEKKEAITGSALKKQEGGRHTPFHNKYRPQSCLRATGAAERVLNGSGLRGLLQDFEKNTENVSGGFGLIGGDPGALPWGSARLIVPVAMDKGLRFGKARHDIALNAIRNMK
jgi:YD repeat-containing protein